MFKLREEHNYQSVIDAMPRRLWLIFEEMNEQLLPFKIN